MSFDTPLSVEPLKFIFQYNYDHIQYTMFAISKSFPGVKLQAFSLPELRKVIKNKIEESLLQIDGGIPPYIFELEYVTRL